MQFFTGLTQVGQKNGDVMAKKDIRVYLKAAVMCPAAISYAFMFALELHEEFHKTFAPKVRPT